MWGVRTKKKAGVITGVTGRQIGGAATESFPDGVVLLQNNIGTDFSTEEIQKSIREKIFSPLAVEFKKAALSPGIGIESLGSHEFAWGNGKNGEKIRNEAEFYDYPNTHSYPLHYWLSASPLAENDKEIVVRINFRGGYIAVPLSHPSQVVTKEKSGPRWTKDSAPALLDLTLGLPRDKNLLIGFPSHDFGPRGNVYWLAVELVR